MRLNRSRAGWDRMNKGQKGDIWMRFALSI